jgi:UDP-N-acetylmuramoyl-tripeptide--D-alanyl-D-alanine ligase
VIVLGEMLELGSASRQEHEKIANYFSSFDKVFTVGDGFKEVAGSEWRDKGDFELIEAINKYLYPGDSILIKGSNRVFWANKFVDRLTESLI